MKKCNYSTNTFFARKTTLNNVVKAIVIKSVVKYALDGAID